MFSVFSELPLPLDRSDVSGALEENICSRVENDFARLHLLEYILGDVNLFSEHPLGKKFNLGTGGTILISEYFFEKVY